MLASGCPSTKFLPWLKPLRKGWGTYLLSRTAWIVHYRWQAAKSIDFIIKFYLYLTMTNMGAIWWGTRGTCPPHFFRRGGHNMPCSPHFFLFGFCIWRGFKKKNDVCYVLCEDLFMLDGRPSIAKFMLQQSLVRHHWFCSFINFSFDKIIFSIFKFLEAVKDV